MCAKVATQAHMGFAVYSYIGGKMADKVEKVPVQQVAVPVVRGLEFHGSAVFTQGDEGVIAENEKFSQIRSALEGVPGLQNVEITHLKAKSAEQTQKDAEKDEKADRRAEAKARKDEEKAIEEGTAKPGEQV